MLEAPTASLLAQRTRAERQRQRWSSPSTHETDLATSCRSRRGDGEDCARSQQPGADHDFDQPELDHRRKPTIHVNRERDQLRLYFEGQLERHSPNYNI